jgi:DNA transformation protein
MASKQSTVDYILEQMSESQEVSARKMFGEYAVYCRGKVVALVCDERLFVKPTSAGRTFIGKVEEGLPYPGAKPWLSIGGELWEDREWLSRLVRMTAEELPLPRPKAPRRKATAKPPRAKPVAKVAAKPAAKPAAKKTGRKRLRR